MKTKYQNTSALDEKITVNVIEPTYNGNTRKFVTVKYADLFYMYDDSNKLSVHYDFNMLDVTTFDWLISVFSEIYPMFY